MEQTPKPKKKLSGKMITILAVIIVVIIAMIPLCLTAPSKEDFEANIPQSFAELVPKRDPIPSYDSIGFMSSYKVIKVVDMEYTANDGSTAVSRESVTLSLLGIAGQVIDTSDNVILTFFVNFVAWLPPLLEGAKITVLLTISSVATGLILSVFLALGKMSKLKILSSICRAYIFFFRGTPLLMQLYFLWFGLPLLMPELTIPDRFLAAWIAFSLNSGAYCAEIIRAAIESIDKGQFEAAKVLGLSYAKTMSKIIIPQTYRRLIPPVANEFIMVLKDASLTSIIALQDLSKITSSILTSSGDVSVFIVSMAIYLVITAAFSKIFGTLEKKFGIYQ